MLLIQIVVCMCHDWWRGKELKCIYVTEYISGEVLLLKWSLF